jgi:hypothetical protein
MIKNDNEMNIDPFKVFIRVRPLLDREIISDVEGGRGSVKPVVGVEDNLVIIKFI